jgi:hypothetical protein
VAASESVRFDIIGNDRGSDAFSRFGRSVADVSTKMDTATARSIYLDDALKRQSETAKRSTDATLALAKSDAILDEVERRLADGALEAEFALKKEADALRGVKREADRLDGKTVNVKVDVNRSAWSRIGGMFGGGGAGGSGAGGLSGLLPGGASAATALANPYAIAGVAAVSPFIAQGAAGTLVAGLGAALAGLGIAGAQGTARVQRSFDALKTGASADLKQIGTAFVPVMTSIYGTAASVLGKLTPVFAGAERTIAGPFRTFSDTLIRAFAQPAVKTAIEAIAKSFGALLTALTPQLGADVAQVADGIARIARSVAEHPQAFADFIKGFFKIAGIALDGISALANFGGYLQQHFWPAMHRTAVIFDGVRHDIAHIWDQIYQNSIGMVIRLGHNIETQFNSLRHGIAVTSDGVRHDIAGAWDVIWNNTVGRVQRGISDVIRWIRSMPGRITAALGSAQLVLAGWGAGVLRGMLAGFGAVWNTVKNFFTSLPSKILGWLGIHSPPQWAIDAGKHIMNGIGIGMSQAHHRVQIATSNIASIATGVAASAVGGTGSVGAEQRYAASLLGGWGWGQGQLGPLIALWNQESGWNPYAVNPSSGAYGIPQALGKGHPYNLGDWKSQIIWGLEYIKFRYGSPAAAWGHEVAAGWYDQGGWLPPGLSLAYNGTGRPEPVGAARGGNTYQIIINVPPTANQAEIGRVTVEAIRQYEKRSGTGWRK